MQADQADGEFLLYWPKILAAHAKIFSEMTHRRIGNYSLRGSPARAAFLLPSVPPKISKFDINY